MKKQVKKIAACTVLACMAVTAVGFAAPQADGQTLSPVITMSSQAAATNSNTPKYVFVCIGDGMSYPQIQSASYYLGANASNGGVQTQELNFMEFPVAGSAQTFDSTSFCPDSASTATSIATGYKTYSGTINMDTTFTQSYETIAEKLKEQKGYKIGIVSSVNLNHATPAAFYAHQKSRNSYYEIGQELVDSGFDYFAGGALLKPTGDDNNQESLYTMAEKQGYNVVNNQTEAEALQPADGKTIIIAETLADADAMSYAMDAESDEWQLADYVEKGIEMLDGDQGFFMMVEGGKIDWACHANDAGATINDTVAMSKAVDKAIEFYNQHPNETLILVTGDHETGGLTIGFAGTDYDTYLTNLSNQKISYAKYDEDYVAGYKANKTSFDEAMQDVKALFGLMMPDDADAAENPNLVLTDYEVSKLKTAYQKTLNANGETLSQAEYVLYGSYEPFSVTVTHILNNKSGINFASYAHTGLPVPVFAKGVGSASFEGYYDNTDIYNKMAALLQVQS